MTTTSSLPEGSTSAQQSAVTSLQQEPVIAPVDQDAVLCGLPTFDPAGGASRAAGSQNRVARFGVESVRPAAASQEGPSANFSRVHKANLGCMRELMIAANVAAIVRRHGKPRNVSRPRRRMDEAGSGRGDARRGASFCDGLRGSRVLGWRHP